MSERMLAEAFVYDHIRTPRGKGKKVGSLHEVKPVDLVVGLLDEIQVRNPGLDPDRVDDVVLGVVSPIGDQGGDIAKTAALAAGLPRDRRRRAAQPLLRLRPRGGQPGRGPGPRRLRGPDPRRRRRVDEPGADGLRRRRLGDRPGHRAHHRLRAAGHRRRPDRHPRGLVAQDVDAYAAESHHRAAKAWANGYFAGSVVPVKDLNGLTVLDHDELIRPDTSVEGLAGLKPSFARHRRHAGFDDVALEKYHWVEQIDHVHHAGNSSGIVDGAALMAIGTEQVGSDLGLTPRARILAAAVSGADPTIMLTGPAPAARKALAKAGLEVERHRPVRDQRGVRRRGDAVHARPGHRPRDHQRQRRRDRDGPPARRDRRDDPRHPDRRARAPRPAPRPGHALRRRRHGHRHHRRDSSDDGRR